MTRRIRIDLDNQLSTEFDNIMSNIKGIMNNHHVTKRDAVRFLIEHYRHNDNISVRKKARSKNEFQFL